MTQPFVVGDRVVVVEGLADNSTLHTRGWIGEVVNFIVPSMGSYPIVRFMHGTWEDNLCFQPQQLALFPWDSSQEPLEESDYEEEEV